MSENALFLLLTLFRKKVKIRRLWDFLIGPNDQFTLEFRALHAVTVLGTILIFLLLLTNIFLQNNIAIAFLGSATIVTPIVHFISRFKRWHKLAIILYGLVATGILVTTFFLKVGSNGPGLFFFPIIYFILLGFIPKQFRVIFLIGNLILIVGLLLFEYVNPEALKIGFISRDILYADLIASVFVGLMLTHFITNYILSTFQNEHLHLIEANNLVRIQNEQLKQLNQEKNKLLSIMSHDLRGSLGSIQGLTDLLTKYSLPEEEKADLVAKIQSQTRVSRNLLDNMLFWAKNQISGSKVNIKSIYLEPLIKEIHGSYKVLASQKGVKLYSKCEENTIIYSDLDYLHLILRNLIANAVKFTMPSGSVTIKAFLKGDNEVIVEIVDTGVGFDTSTIKNVGPEGLDSTLGTNGEKGTGLGLVLVYDYVNLMNAKIECESSKESGTTFRLVLPSKLPITENLPVLRV